MHLMRHSLASYTGHSTWSLSEVYQSISYCMADQGVRASLQETQPSSRDDPSKLQWSHLCRRGHRSWFLPYCFGWCLDLELSPSVQCVECFAPAFGSWQEEEPLGDEAWWKEVVEGMPLMEMPLSVFASHCEVPSTLHSAHDRLLRYSPKSDIASCPCEDTMR